MDDPNTIQLDLSHLGSTHITARIYDILTMKKLQLNNNHLKHLSTELQYLVRYDKISVCCLYDNYKLNMIIYIINYV